MDLIERYVNEVGRKLPRKGRVDIKAELNSNLRDMADDRFKGQATDDDIAQLLKEFGSPDEVAASYRPAGQYLIGPELYPYFKLVTGAVLLALTIGLTVVFAVGFIFGESEPSEIGNSLLSMWSALFQAYLAGFASVVVVFAILQYLGAKQLGLTDSDEQSDDWDPLTLPEVKDIDMIGRGESAAGLAAGVVFLVLLNLFADQIGIVVTWGDEVLFNNILQDNLLWLNMALLLGVGLNLVLLIQGRWHLYTRLVKIALDLFWIFVVYQIVNSVVAEKSAMVEAGLIEPLPTMFAGMGYVVVVIMSISFIVNLVKWIVGEMRRPVVDETLAAKLS